MHISKVTFYLISGLSLVFFPQPTSSPSPGTTCGVGTDSVFNYQALFQQDCAGCHGLKAQGVYAPNLTDQYWLHGGDMKSILATLRGGVPGTGMIAWRDIFTVQQTQKMAEYVVSLQGSNPPKAKKPEGRLCEQEKVPEKE